MNGRKEGREEGREVERRENFKILSIYTYILPNSSVPSYPRNLAYYPKQYQNASLKLK